MCRRSCYYRAGLTAGHDGPGSERSCNYCTMTGRTRTAELIDAYKKKGRKLTDWERKRILTDEEHCPWHRPPTAQGLDAALPAFFNSQRTMVEVTCRSCGKTFLGGRRALYCPDCRDRKKREKQAEWWHTEVEAVCRDCGRTFTGTRHMKLCPECCRRHRAEGGRNSVGHKGRGPARKKVSA